LESQHVKTLIEGYLRGWLNFDYSLKTSILREKIILNYIEEERLYSLLKNKLFIETCLRSGLDHTTQEILKPIFEINKSLIELKLPSLAPEDKIDNNTISKDSILEWKEFLDKVNKN
jgi:hypothetical protein